MAVERHIVPALGGVPLQGLTLAHLTAFYRALLDDGRRDGSGGLAPMTVRNVHGVLHTALRDAVRWGYLPRNVAGAADLPKDMTPEMHVWSPEQLRAFLAQGRHDPLYAAWLLFTTTGMRRGEVAGLRWADVDLDAGRVSPRRPRVVSTMRSSSPSRRPPRAAARLPWTRPPWPRSATTAAGSFRGGRPPEDPAA
jgi:integrase